MKKKHIIMLTLSFILLLAALQVSAAYKTSYSNEYYQPWGRRNTAIRFRLTMR